MLTAGAPPTHLVEQQDDALAGVQAAHVALHIRAAAAGRVARIKHLHSSSSSSSSTSAAAAEPGTFSRSCRCAGTQQIYRITQLRASPRAGCGPSCLARPVSCTFQGGGPAEHK
eukprot:GHRQ01013767.1.p2 GENE.GHRQ01013767.1~~GHRQ01013767.1.p2  ORF type:complete len:114 (-),score=30.57 GHRQ01013767.1:324-665(-)